MSRAVTSFSPRLSRVVLFAMCTFGCGTPEAEPTDAAKPEAKAEAKKAGAQEIPAMPPATAANPAATAPSNGFNDNIAWRGLSEGFAEAKKTGRPLMLLVHASWCPKCKKLKPQFHSPSLAKLSEQFVMVNVDQDLAPEVEQHAPDGNYVPRILFFDGKGELDASIQNPVRSRYRYFYMPHDDLIGTMKQALERHAAKP